MKEQTTTAEVDWNSFSSCHDDDQRFETNFAWNDDSSIGLFFFVVSNYCRVHLFSLPLSVSLYASLLNTWKILIVDSWQRNKQNGRRYYVLVVVHCSTTDVRKGKSKRERKHEARKESDWRIVYVCVGCYRRNMPIRWLPATSQESKCVCVYES